MREKVTKLLTDAMPSCYSDVFASQLADHLIANDVVPVVRCKDCEYWLKDVAGCTEQVGRCEWANYMVGAAGYCVYGERKDDG